MRPSPKKHTLAILRLALGMSQKEMAELVKRSTRTIQAIELCQLPLSAELGSEIARETGVSPKWLMDGDTTKPIIDAGRRPYTRETFEGKQAWIKRKLGDYPNDLWW